MGIELKSISELNGMSFYIPCYQRGYRWTEQQVKDLLNDIDEFSPQNENGFYCLQPIVVKDRKSEKDVLCKINEKIGGFTNIDEIKQLLIGEWEVIDGQQRLTTIFLILKYLEQKLFTISYETRKDSKDFLEDIKEDKAKSNIDFFHIWKAYKYIEEWFDSKGNDKSKLLNKLKGQVKVIWYESEKEDPVKVFTRLNIGKISLTNAELIKALFLNRSNFERMSLGEEHLRLRQQEIASEWDNIEYTLQNDEFWLFLNNVGYSNPTRIDFIFDIICQDDKLGIRETVRKKHNEQDWDKVIGTDEYRTFRYFYEYFRLNENKIEECWKIVKKYFLTFKEWYDDLEFYHYIGFLVAQGEKIENLLKKWEEDEIKKFEEKESSDAEGEERGNINEVTKESFLQSLYDKIKGKIKNCKDLNKQYEIEGSPDKTTCRPLLLLHNIQTVINQGENATEEYGNKVFYKFPFHIYKLEKWDIEHIDSNNTNQEEDKKTQDEWLLNVFGIVKEEDLKENIKEFVSRKDQEGYDTLKGKVLKELGDDENNKLNDEEKNKIMNFTLLDESTNRGYGNSIFAVKRRKIIDKDQGMVTPPPTIDNGEVTQGAKERNKNGTAFIAPCTKSVFLKYYSSTSPSLNYWYKSDAEAYKNDIYKTLKEFGVTLNEEEQK